MISYSQVVEESARSYIRQLNGIKDDDRESANKITRLYSLALAEESDKTLLRALEETYLALSQVKGHRRRRRFCNQYALGLGDPQAPFVFVGQEWAFDLNSTRNFVVESCLLTFFWLVDGRESLAQGITRRLQEMFPKAVDALKSFHRSPNDYYVREDSGHTWNVMSKMITSLLGSPVTLGPGQNNFARHSYFLKIGAIPSKENEGTEILQTREKFLPHLLNSLKPRYLIIHGNTSKFRNIETRIKYESMLAVNQDLNWEHFPLKNGKRLWKQHAARDRSRIVFWTQQLSGSNRFSDDTYDKWAKWLHTK